MIGFSQVFQMPDILNKTVKTVFFSTFFNMFYTSFKDYYCYCFNCFNYRFIYIFSV